MTPFRDASKIQARFQAGDAQQLSSYNAEENLKLKLKRAQTLKQETPTEKVIEEGSDDNDSGFASETPAH
jgi:hypothetical protein